jgi:hypothetical protein
MSTQDTAPAQVFKAYAQTILADMHPDYDDHYPQAVAMFDHFERNIASLPAEERLPEAGRLVKLFELAEGNKDLASIIGAVSLLNDETPYPVKAHKNFAEMRAQTLFSGKNKTNAAKLLNAARQIEKSGGPDTPSKAIANVYLYRIIGLKN